MLLPYPGYLLGQLFIIVYFFGLLHEPHLVRSAQHTGRTLDCLVSPFVALFLDEVQQPESVGDVDGQLNEKCYQSHPANKVKKYY